MNISERIKYYREKKGITVNKLANQAGLSQSYLREIEMGIKNPTVETISLLCDTLRISLKDFFSIDDENKIFNDTLDEVIFRLTPDQRKKLAEFLKTMQL